MLIQWGPEHSLGIKEIDQQHQTFVGIINELEDSINSLTLNSQLEFIFKKLAGYSDYHFATEEKYFDLFQYPEAAPHKQKHSELKSKVLEMKKDFEREKDVAIAGKLIDFLEDWLLEHLDKYDREYVKYFQDHGLS